MTFEIEKREFGATLARCRELGGADLIFTSPPYCDARTYNEDVSFTFDDYRHLGDAVFGALKPGGHCLFNVDAPVRDRRNVGSERGLEPFKIAVDWTERVGLRFVDRLCFYRQGAPGAYVGRFRNDWEPMFWFQRPGERGTFRKERISQEAKHAIGDHHTATNRRVDGGLNSRYASAYDRKHRGTVWEYGAVGHGRSGATELEGTDHPARFPYRLARDVILCFSDEGQMVCDPFVGSGTTGLACRRLGRSFVGGDALDREDGLPWAKIARSVCDAPSDEDQDERPEGGLFDLFE